MLRGTARGLLRRIGQAAFTVAIVDAYASAVAANGGSVSAGRQALLVSLVNASVSCGHWWRTDDIALLVAENAGSALTTLKRRSLMTATNAPTFSTDAGYAFDGLTQYIDTGFVPSLHGQTMSVDNCRIAVYERTNVTVARAAAGALSTSNQSIRLTPRVSGNAIGGPNSRDATFTLPLADSRGFTSLSRTTASASTVAAYKNGASMTRTADPAGYGTSLPAVSIFIGGYNNVGTLASPRASTIGLLEYGAAIPDESSWYTALQTFMTAVGANV